LQSLKHRIAFLASLGSAGTAAGASTCRLCIYRISRAQIRAAHDQDIIGVSGFTTSSQQLTGCGAITHGL